MYNQAAVNEKPSQMLYTLNSAGNTYNIAYGAKCVTTFICCSSMYGTCQFILDADLIMSVARYEWNTTSDILLACNGACST